MNKQIKELIDEVIEIKENLEQLEERKEIVKFLYNNFTTMSEFQFNVIQDYEEGIAHDLYTYLSDLLNLYLKKELKTMQTLQIIQWGSKRSIVLLTYTDTKEQEYLLMDNDYLLNLDEMGVLS